MQATVEAKPAVVPYTRPESRKVFWAGWVLTILLTGMLLFSATMKLLRPQLVIDEFTRLGYAPRLAAGIGILEVVCAILFVIPRTSVLGAILVAAYLGGATATHVRVGDAFVGPVIFGVVAWMALLLRDARIRQLLPLCR